MFFVNSKNSLNKIVIYFILLSLSSLAYEERDNVFFLSKELNGTEDKEFVLCIKKVEALAKRHLWWEAYNLSKELSLNVCSTNTLESGESWSLVFNTISLYYRFHSNPDDDEIINLTDKALREYAKSSAGKRFFFYSKLYRLKMAYFWRLGDKFKHDFNLKELALYDPLEKEPLLSLLNCYRERPWNFKDSNDFLLKYSIKTNTNDPTFQTAAIFLSGLPKDKKWELGLKWFVKYPCPNDGELIEHLKFMADFLSFEEQSKIKDYCECLAVFLSKQPDETSRISVITLALNEYYRIKYLIGF